MTDTGNFMHNVQSETFEIVSKIIAVGIDRDYIYNKVFNNYSEDRMRLLGYALSQKMVVLSDIGTAIISLDKHELKKYNFQIGDTEGFVNMPLAIRGINSSILLLEKDHQVKISFRSKGDIPINKIAKEYFNGGGHKNAAGGSEKVLNIEDAFLKLKRVLKENSEILI
jgi:phosphoesterase RecJ-like protein